uniref:Tyr recombinase domain-containing protein n=1 Tax=Glossina brevipalpis TaxID=37001 RepID=A0A1A9VZ74_9MUSC
MFSALIKLDEFSGQNPLHGLPPLAEKNPEMTFFDVDEINNLLSVLSGDERLIALLCLSTGGRWGEVSTLTPTQIVKGRVTFLETKNGKKRTVPISAQLEGEVKMHASSHLFKVDYEKFCIKLRSVKPDLPHGQATHVLRHTFASHFMMNGGNIIALQEILGHANIQQTMAYAHLAPDYLQNAVALNPLKGGLASNHSPAADAFALESVAVPALVESFIGDQRMQTFHFANIDTGRIAAGEAHEVTHLLPLLFRQLNVVKHAVMAFLYPMCNGILLPAFQSIVISSYSINRDQRGGDEQEDVFVHPGPP